jgi:hypothetical protein
MKTRLVALALTTALMGLFTLAPMSAGAQPATAGGTATITGPGGLTGTLTNLVASVNQAGQLVLTGTFTGQVPVNGVLQDVTSTFEAILAGTGTANAACNILTLDVGAIHLDLLGLVIDTAPIHLTITAQPGAGNLLGNLLCGVAHLLDTNASNNALANFLNRIIGLLGL